MTLMTGARSWLSGLPVVPQREASAIDDQRAAVEPVVSLLFRGTHGRFAWAK
jgi:hypothetical protein